MFMMFSDYMYLTETQSKLFKFALTSQSNVHHHLAILTCEKQNLVTIETWKTKYLMCI